MQHPDWIGPPVESAWWQLGEPGVAYRIKRPDSEVRDTHVISLPGGEDQIIDAAGLAAMDGPSPVISSDGALALTMANGSLLLRDLSTGSLRRLYTGSAPVTKAHFSANGEGAYFLSDAQWWFVSLTGEAAVLVTDLRFKDAPDAAGTDALEAEQLRLFSTLERERRYSEEQLEMRIANAAAEPTLGAAPWYLGDDCELLQSALSADGRYLLAAVRKAAGKGGKESKEGKGDKMPHFVARSGYVDIEDVRRLVGRNDPRPHDLRLLDLAERTKTALDLDGLSGRDRDPLAALKKAQDLTVHDKDNLRPLQVAQLVWHPESSEALIQLRAVDNKDRWTMRLSAVDGDLDEIHRLTNEAWVNNWVFRELGWVPGTDTAWLTSEESGFSHLYTIDSRGRAKQHTRGDFEVMDIVFAGDGSRAWMMSNREHPTSYDLYEYSLDEGTLAKKSSLKGLEQFAIHPDGRHALLVHSGSYTPKQVMAVDLESGATLAETDTRTAAYAALDWQMPEYVPVPSSHVDEPIWSKFYPARGDFEGPRPVVLFVHGAGYTQNTHYRFPYYFREQMFHNLLTARGYHVLDMDYRASRGYGRDWRTSIYRQMGTPELEDLIDGVNWLVREYNADPERVGVYGGSYGGFMTLMAMFNAPEVFAAGASLRPVTDWRHYNHGYTSNILNTPQVDPEAHRISSPIEFVEGLQGDLLIAHGMLDDNVFYKDSVRIAQRLIELEKENWELASYPLEPHGYVHPESWLDQYRRILKLFESSIGDAQ